MQIKEKEKLTEINITIASKVSQNQIKWTLPSDSTEKLLKVAESQDKTPLCLLMKYIESAIEAEYQKVKTNKGAIIP